MPSLDRARNDAGADQQRLPLQEVRRPQEQGGILQPPYQYMGTPADTDAESPVNRWLQKR